MGVSIMSKKKPCCFLKCFFTFAFAFTFVSSSAFGSSGSGSPISIGSAGLAEVEARSPTEDFFFLCSTSDFDCDSVYAFSSQSTGMSSK